MAVYALIIDGKVVNTILWDGPEVAPMELEKGTTYAEVPDGDGNQPSIGWSYDGKTFTSPPLTDEEVSAANEQKKAANVALKASLIARATIAIDPLQDAVDLDVATNEEIKSLKAWKQYRVAVNRIDAYTADVIDWPNTPS